MSTSPDPERLRREGYHDQLMVEFSGNYRVRLREGEFVDLSERADRVELGRLVHLGAWARAYTLGEDLIDDIRRQAEAVKGTPMADLNNYYYFSAGGPLTSRDALEVLKASPLITFAGQIPVAFPATPPDFEGSDTWKYQRYLDAAPDGIDARWAWLGAGGRGEGVRVCDVEYGFNPNHVDLPTVGVLGPNLIDDTHPEHGTSVLGMLVGRDNGFGVTGIVCDADCSFHYASAGGIVGGITPPAFHDAIMTFLQAASVGDIILIEAQIVGPNYGGSGEFGLVPVDWFKPTYDAVKIATAKVLVVECAGNGSQLLDDSIYQEFLGHHPFELDTRSGALIVGAGYSPYAAEAGIGDPPTPVDARTRIQGSNHGKIVRMQGWGDSIATAGYGDLHPGGEAPDISLVNEFYTGRFRGTSGAAPMVVGAAAALQGVHKKVFGIPLWPAQVESLLLETGTAQQGSDVIGPLPNIRAAVEKVFTNMAVLPTTAGPVLTPSGGAYDFPITVQFDYGASDQNKHNTVIRFTVDGSEPGWEHGSEVVPEDGGSKFLNFGVTIRAVALTYHAKTLRWYPSEIVEQTYIGGMPVVATPTVVLPGPGNEFVAPLAITLTCETPEASIRYRTDGTTISPWTPGKLYSAPLSLGVGEYSFVVRAFKEGHYGSATVYLAALTVTAPQVPQLPGWPTVAPSGGSFLGGVEVTMDYPTPEAHVRYTTDGSNVQASSTLYAKPFWLYKSATVRARAFREGYQPSVHAPTTGFAIVPVPKPPVIHPPSGGRSTFTDSVEVSIKKPAGAEIVRYTTNGSEPNNISQVPSPEYVGPFTLGVGLHTIKAKAWTHGDALESRTATAVYNVKSVVERGPSIEPVG